ncbi:hypothetical protein [Streptomyces sp. NPDC056296]|uniref:hypothetical protein n=1 Tax=Streptomyces sp. NPDC056296 TaxID=3345775 RepID=UPI0035DB8AB4
MTRHAIRLNSVGGAVTVVSAEQAVTALTVRYFGTWWHATETGPAKQKTPVVAADGSDGHT